MRQTWILVADSSRARLFAWEHGRLRELRTFSHPDSRAKRADLIDGGRGRFAESTGASGAMTQPTDPKDYEAERFARELVEHLEAYRNQHTFDRLCVAAPPSLLGTMRTLYSPALAKLVDEEIDKNLVALRPDAIREQLPYRL
jgi:protein required for attachment to host cells